MIEPIYSRRWGRFWSWYIRRIIRKTFDKFEYDADFPVARDRGLLVIANHFSWWDGFLLYRLNELLFSKRFHVMVLEEVIRDRPAVRTLGAFSVKKGSRGVLESLDFATSLLERPENLVGIYPQGVLQSIHVSRPAFERGVCRIIDRASRPIQVVFCVALVDYASRRKPMVRFHLAEYRAPGRTGDELEAAFLEHYEKARVVQTEKLYEPFP